MSNILTDLTANMSNTAGVL